MSNRELAAETGGPEAGGPEAGGSEAGGPEAGGPEAGGSEAGGPEATPAKRVRLAAASEPVVVRGGCREWSLRHALAPPRLSQLVRALKVQYKPRDAGWRA